MEQILPDRNISESDPLANVANNSSTQIFRTLQFVKITYTLFIIPVIRLTMTVLTIPKQSKTTTFTEPPIGLYTNFAL